MRDKINIKTYLIIATTIFDDDVMFSFSKIYIDSIHFCLLQRRGRNHQFQSSIRDAVKHVTYKYSGLIIELTIIFQQNITESFPHYGAA